MDAVAQAIADPARRRILEELAKHPLTAGEIAALFTISRPAVSRHLRVLRESGLVIDQPEGRHRRYAVNTTTLRPLASWIAALDRAARWESNLDALNTEVHRTKRERRRPTYEQEKTAWSPSPLEEYPRPRAAGTT